MAAKDTTERDELRWPASAWAASAPESYVLLNYQRRPAAREALKLGILELLARRCLNLVEVERSGLLGRRTRASVLVRGHPVGETALGSVLTALRDVFAAQRQRHEPLWGAGSEGEHVDGLDVADYARAIVRRYGSVDGFVQQVVRPELIERGWLAAQRYRILGIFPATRYVLTQDGVAAQGDLLWRVDYGNRQLGRLVDDAPARAVAFAGLAGASVLLMDDARPHLQRLKERLAAGSQPQTQTESGAVAASGTAADPSGVDLDPSGLDVDAGSLDLDATGLDLSGLDAVDSAMDAVDSGVDAGSGGDGGGGGGGDGGGGDGGGGSSS